jgi:hypothetical protein
MLPNRERTMRYLVVGIVCVAVGALVAAPTAVLIDRSQRPDNENEAVLAYENEALLVYVAKEAIPKGTLITRNDQYVLTAFPRKALDGKPMPVIPWVGAVATKDIRRGDPHTVGDFRDQCDPPVVPNRGC